MDLKLIVVLHGHDDQPDWLAKLVRAHVEVDVVALRGPIVDGDRNSWFEPGDGEQLALVLDDLDALLARECHARGVERGETSVVGFSQGATVALSLALTGDCDPFHSVVAFAGFLTASPRRFSWDRDDLPKVLLTSAAEDEVVTADLAEHAHGTLERRGVTVELWQVDGGHTVSPELAGRALNWVTA